MKKLIKIYLIVIIGITASFESAHSSLNAQDYGVKCDGHTDDTDAINNALKIGKGTTITLPKGDCQYGGGGILLDGTVLKGMGKFSTSIWITKPNVTNFMVSGRGAGIKEVAFKAAVPQTAGHYIVLAGIDSFIEDFFMDGDYNGILMTGSVARIRHGRFQDGAKNAIRIRAEGGDNTQAIDDVFIGVQNPPVTSVGIRVRNSSALVISKTSVITQGIGLLIDPYNDKQGLASDAGSVYSLWVDNSFFDNSQGEGIKIAPTGTASVVRSRFSNIWTSSSGKDGFLITNQGTGLISGIQILGNHSLLNQGDGINLQGKMEDISIDNNIIAQNSVGIHADSVTGLRITNSTIGKGGGVNGNKKQGLAIGSRIDKLLIQGNDVTGNTLTSIVPNDTNNIIKDNFGLTQLTGN